MVASVSFKLNLKGIHMKQLLIVSAATCVLSACGTGGTNYSAQYNTQHALQASQIQSAIDQAPDFMSKLPKSQVFIFENVTAISTDFGFADIKAKTIAYAKICTALGGKVRSQVKMFKSDSGETATEQSEMAIRSMCPDVDLSGVETVAMKHVADGNRIRTYVLISLAIGNNNAIKSAKDAQSSAPKAFEELDQITKEQLGRGGDTPTAITQPKGEQTTVVKPDQSIGALNLLPVENEEYRKRRAEALKKPGAVIGQTFVE